MHVKHCAVMGNPIEHSLSPIIHQKYAEQTGIALRYDKIHVPCDEFEAAVATFFSQGGTGLNITMPFKERAFNMAKVCTQRCQRARSANTLWMHDGILHADTTDGVGLIRDLTRIMELDYKIVLIFGAGGAARSIIQPLLAANVANITVSNRSKDRGQVLCRDFSELSYKDWQDIDFSSYDLLINTAGSMDPADKPREDVICAREDVICAREDVICAREEVICAREEVICAREEVICAREEVGPNESIPSSLAQLASSLAQRPSSLAQRPSSLAQLASSLAQRPSSLAQLPSSRGLSAGSTLNPRAYCYDLSYNLKGPTPFVTWARQQGLRVQDGLGMLIEQAAESFFIWHGVMPNATAVRVDILPKHTAG
jgi:shikimate dehydrogenase